MQSSTSDVERCVDKKFSATYSTTRIILVASEKTQTCITIYLKVFCAPFRNIILHVPQREPCTHIEAAQVHAVFILPQILLIFFYSFHSTFSSCSLTKTTTTEGGDCDITNVLSCMPLVTTLFCLRLLHCQMKRKRKRERKMASLRKHHNLFFRFD